MSKSAYKPLRTYRLCVCVCVCVPGVPVLVQSGHRVFCNVLGR